MQTVTMDSLGVRLRAAREKAGMTAAAASKALGFRASNVVTRWENGDNRPDPDDVVRLAAIYPDFRNGGGNGGGNGRSRPRGKATAGESACEAAARG